MVKFQLEEMVREINKNKSVEVSFDEKCIAKIEIGYVNGAANIEHVVEYKKAKVIVDGGEPSYLDIDAHRESRFFSEIKSNLENTNNFFITPEYANSVTDKEVAERLGISDEKAKSLREESAGKLKNQVEEASL
jgi:DNA-directed RNA polymerase specialized sigma subunit